MTCRLPSLALVFSLLASTALADMIVINGRYVVAKDTIRGYFYNPGSGRKQTVFEVRWSDWSTKYRCENEYDRANVEAASLNLTLALQDARALDFKTFLEGQGYQECNKF